MTTFVQMTMDDLTGLSQGRVGKILHVTGQLDESNVDEQAKGVYRLIEANPQNLYLILELTGLEYMNSKSIGYLTDWYSKVSASGGKVVIAGARENILDILQVVWLTQLISTYSTLDEAKLAVMQ
jgi:anti-anti-sigma factor